MKTMGDLLDDSPEGKFIRCILDACIWPAILPQTRQERDLLLRTVRIYIGLHLVQHGDRSIMLALLMSHGSWQREAMFHVAVCDWTHATLYLGITYTSGNCRKVMWSQAEVIGVKLATNV